MRCPCMPLTKWRQRVGGNKLAKMLSETVALAVGEKQVAKQELAPVNVDTTVQEENITPPTDSKLYHTACTIRRSSSWSS